MRILLAADGSPFTKKALAFVVANPNLLAGAELAVHHVQPALPPRVTALVGHRAVAEYHEEEARAVLAPIEEFLQRHGLPVHTRWSVGPPAKEILQAANRDGAQMIVMGTHGYGLLGRALMGSVAQGVLSGAEVPVLLVK